MRNKEFQKLFKKKQSKSNSGFTLTELLVGLFMSIFVIGALGFGLTTVLQATQRENSKTAARNENSRALDFISDEIRSARTIDTDATNAGTSFSSTDLSGNTKKVILALDIPEIASSATASARGRIVYYTKSDGNGNWKGPLVLYRWGPPLGANGDYNIAGTWQEEALIDGINNTTVTLPCPAGTTTTPTTPQGFYACITGTNTAQLFLTGQTKVASGINDTQTNDSQVVARARATLAQRTDENDAVNWNVEGLGGSFNCRPPSTTWDMQTDFTNNPGNSSKTTSWTQSTNLTRQAQPIEIDSSKPLKITSTAVGQTNCLNNPTPISHTIDFGNPKTFNGDHATVATKNVSDVTADKKVQFFKKGFEIPSYGGYNVDGQGEYNESEGDQLSLGQFLYSKGLAIPVGEGNPNLIATTFRLPTAAELESYLISSSLESQLTSKGLTDAQKQEFKDKFKTLGDDQRIIGFEMGDHADTSQPGFDLQDNIFVVTSNVFKKKFPDSSF